VSDARDGVHFISCHLASLLISLGTSRARRRKRAVEGARARVDRDGYEETLDGARRVERERDDDDDDEEDEDEDEDDHDRRRRWVDENQTRGRRRDGRAREWRRRDEEGELDDDGRGRG